MAPLPDFLFDTHKRYKADTEKVLTWLVRTAKKYRFTLETPTAAAGGTPKTGPSRRLKGKARAEARKAGSPASNAITSISVKQFAEMAEKIGSRRPPVQVPEVILTLLRSAITLRKRCADWFGRMVRDKEEHEVNAKHRHFIDVLQIVLNNLESKPQVSDKKDAKPADGPGTDVEDGFSNMFDILSIDDDALNESIETSLNPSALHTSFAQRTTPRSERYQFQYTDEEVYFALYCFFEDLDKLRDYLDGLWAEYKDGEIDLITASITTNTAFELVQSAEKDFNATFPLLNSYEEISQVFYLLICILRGEDPQNRERPDDIVNLRMIDVAEFLYMPSYSTLVSFCNVIQPNRAPVYKPGHFGIYDPHCDREKLTIREKMQEDRIILLEVLPEFFILSEATDGHRIFGGDELTHGIGEMCRTKEIPLWLAFATQIYLDIHHILRTDVTRGFSDLQAAGQQTKATLDAYFPRSQLFTNWPAQNEQAIMEIKKFLDKWILTDELAATKSRLYGPDLAQFLPQKEPFALYRWHPILCGFFEFKLYLFLQDAGITLATAWGSILYVAHLYHACRDHLTIPWPDMELVMQIHTPEQIFAGRVPQNPTQSLNSMSLMLGTSPVSFARHGANRRPGLKHSRKGPKGLKENTPLTEVLRRRYFEGGDLSLTLETVEGLLKDKKIQLPTFEQEQSEGQAPERGQSVVQKQWAKSHKLTVLQLLEALRYAMIAERYALRFDYISFHLRCLDLLRAIRQELDAKFRQYFTDDYIENETQLPFLVGYIFMVASSTHKMEEVIHAETESLMVLRAAGVLDKFIEDKSILECKKLLALVNGGRGIGSTQS